jgi:hypothetical protein
VPEYQLEPNIYNISLAKEMLGAANKADYATVVVAIPRICIAKEYSVWKVIYSKRKSTYSIVGIASFLWLNIDIFCSWKLRLSAIGIRHICYPMQP